jgi:hypothetical protein
VFAGPDGKVFFCALNYCGSWADSSLTACFLPHITKRIGNFKICVDKGFPSSGSAYNVLVGPFNDRTARRLHLRLRNYLLCVSNVYTSLCQASEWGMGGMQGTFHRCKKCLPSDSLNRRLVLESIVLVGLNQIKTVFDPEYERYVNVEGYGRISQ